VEEKPSKWENQSDDELDLKRDDESDVVEDHDDVDVRPVLDSDDHASVDDKTPAQARKGAKYTNSAINFKYTDYTDLTVPVSELNDKDLVKVLIVRAHNNDQRALGDVLKQTLRAMNLECAFPTTVPLVKESRFSQERGPKPVHAGRGGSRGGYRGGRYQASGGPPSSSGGGDRSYESHGGYREREDRGSYEKFSSGRGARY